MIIKLSPFTLLILQVTAKITMLENFVVMDDGTKVPKSVTCESDAMKYLNIYGYMSKTEASSGMKPQKMESVIMDYQRFMGIPETGHFDNKTMDMMNMPRCGVKDNANSRTHRVYRHMGLKRVKRYQLQGSVWQKRNITWRVTKYSSRENLRGKERQIDEIMHIALNEWSNHCGLTFIKAPDGQRPLIDIQFNVGDHHDGNPFDGPGRTLAHAFFPQYGGDTHFDDHEQWTIDSRVRGVDLMSVAVHEFGHALGLGHSDIRNSIMYPTYAGQRRKLEKDDIQGITTIYGKKPKESVRPSNNGGKEKSMPDAKNVAPDLCSDFKIDAAECMSDGKCFFFRGNYVWRIAEDTSVFPGYPKLISNIFPGLNGKIDAVLTDTNREMTLFFKGQRIWIYKEIMKAPLIENALIDEEIIGFDVFNVNAATRWGFNGRMYIFKDDLYWRYDSERKTSPISRRYPQSIRIWNGIPKDVDAAMFWPKTKKTYFFKGKYYYRFNDMSNTVDDVKPSFPRETTKWWLKCDKQKKGTENKKKINTDDYDADYNIIDDFVVNTKPKTLKKNVPKKSGELNESNDPTANDGMIIVEPPIIKTLNNVTKISKFSRFSKALKNFYRFIIG